MTAAAAAALGNQHNFNVLLQSFPRSPITVASTAHPHPQSSRKGPPVLLAAALALLCTFGGARAKDDALYTCSQRCPKADFEFDIEVEVKPTDIGGSPLKYYSRQITGAGSPEDWVLGEPLGVHAYVGCQALRLHQRSPGVLRPCADDRLPPPPGLPTAPTLEIEVGKTFTVRVWCLAAWHD